MLAVKFTLIEQFAYVPMHFIGYVDYGTRNFITRFFNKYNSLL